MFPLSFIVFLSFHVYIAKPIDIYLEFSVLSSMFKFFPSWYHKLYYLEAWSYFIFYKKQKKINIVGELWLISCLGMFDIFFN